MKVHLLELLDAGTWAKAAPLLGVSAISGALQALMIPLITWGTHHGIDQPLYWVAAGAYVVLLVAAYLLRTRLSPRVPVLFEKRIATLREDMLTRVREASLRTVERDDDIHEAFTRDLETLTNLPRLLDGVAFNGALLLCITVFLVTQSIPASLLWVGLCTLIIYVLRGELQESFDAAEDFDAEWGAFSKLSNRMLSGIAQIKLDGRIANGVMSDLNRLVSQLGTERRRRDYAHRDAELKIQLVSHGVLFLVLFGIMQIGIHDVESVFTLVLVVIFAEGPLFDLIETSPYLIAGEVAWRKLRDGETRLPAELPEDAPRISQSAFEEIRLEQVRFRYALDADFHIGPLDLTLRRRELVFVVGGNGSGKTTVMKLLCGLYHPLSGRISLDSAPVIGHNRAAYRSLFTVVFAEHTLFDRTYGLDPDEERVDALLDRFALKGVTAVESDRFTDLALSSGQQKRLAMVVALLEDRPIFVLDEWAAHQDPELRRYFYETLLPELKAQGKTIVAVSHDDRFFHLADRVIHLERGCVISDVHPEH